MRVAALGQAVAAGGSRGAIASGVVASAALAVWPIGLPVAPRQAPGAGMVAAAHPVAAAAGAEILARGGNAVDAAVATAAALGVAEPFGSGIGGGGFFLVYQAESGEVLALDCRETAPATATADMFLDPDTGEPYPRGTLLTGGLSVGVPGQVRCWAEAQRRWGRLGLAEALAPAIRAARDGFEVTPYFVREVGVNRRRLEQFPESARRFLPGGDPPAVGSRFVQPELAATLELIAGRGADAFYAELAPEIAAAAASPTTVPSPTIALQPGRLSAEDVAEYRVQVRQPVRGRYRGYSVVTHPAPSSGPTLVETLNLLESFDLGALGPDSPASVHLLSEAQRVANADRFRWLGDPDVEAVPCAGLVSPDYAELRRRLIALDRTATTVTAPGDPRPLGAGGCDAAAETPQPRRDRPAAGEDPDADLEAVATSHLSVIDGEGNAVAYTATLATHFGSAIMVPGRGFFLNDTLTNFRADPNAGPSNNLAAPRKRPRSSIAPAFIFDPAGRLRWVFGAAGAEWITPAVAQLAVAFVDWGLAPQAAVDRARFIPGNARGAIALEPALFDGRPELVAALQEMGHTVTRESSARGAAQVVALDPATGQLSGGADRRRDGAIAEAVARP